MGTSHANDFVIDWQGDMENTTKLIFQRILLNPINDNKPLFVVLTGESGSGKSYTAIKLQDWIYNARDLDYANYLTKNIVLNPLGYAIQIQEILNDKELKPIFTIQIDEGRFVVGAENWGTFVNTSIGHVNASTRAIRPMITFIVTQSLRDIDKRLRDSINIQLICRKKNGQVFVTVRKFWVDDRDLENVKLRYRRMQGTINFDDGTKQRVMLAFRPKIIRNELKEPYETLMKSIKGSIIDKVMERLLIRIKKDLGETQLGRVEIIADKLISNRGLLLEVGKMQGSRWRSSENSEVLGLNAKELKKLQVTVNKGLRSDVNGISKKPIS